jgi:CHAD domain-containing protein
MLKDNMISYLKLNASIFIKMFDRAIKTANVEAVHDMRVSLKRIDTLLRLLNYNKKSNFRLKKCFKPLRRLFKLAGPLRDFQVQLILLEEIKQKMIVEELIIKQFNVKKNLLADKFRIKHQSFNLFRAKRNLRLAEEYLVNIDEMELSEQIVLFEMSRKVLLGHYSNKGKQRYSLHRARKMLKDLSYIIEMSNQKPFNDIPQFTTYKETGHYLGIWHDRDVMLKYLKELNKDSKNASENAQNLYLAVKEQRETIQKAYLEKYKTWENA